ncbi:hypothetical protein, partial [Staphylococcus pseudintermedius]|uniref:hypothetical protein n=1 Tax=Staphylococcus pseudintermedius TaxID=283734 RepID=UPI001C92DA27
PNMVDIYTTPAMEAPEGKTSNLVNPYSLKDTRIGLSSAALAVTFIFVAIRVYVRRMLRKFNSEDCTLQTGLSFFCDLS